MAISKRINSAVVTVGVVFLILGLAFFWDYFSFSPGTVKAEGRVLSVNVEFGSKGTVYASTASYTVNGIEFTTRDGFFTNIWKPSEGDKVIVLYKAEQPKLARIYFWSPYSVPLAIVLFGSILLLIAFFDKIREKNRHKSLLK